MAPPTRDPANRTRRAGMTFAILTVLSPVVATVAGLLLPDRIGDAVTALSNGQDVSADLQWLGLVLLAAVAGNALGTFATGAFVATRTARVRADVARSVILSPNPFGAAGLVTRILVDARQPAAILPIVTSMTLAAVSVIGGLVLLALIDWTLLVGVVVGLLIILVLLRRLVGDLSPLIQRYRRAQGEVGQRLLDAQAGAVTIRAAGTWRREVARVLIPMHQVRAAGDELWSAQKRFAWKTAVFVPAMLFMTIGVGGWALSAGRIDTGGFAAAVGYTLVILGGLDGIEAAAGLGAVRAGQARIAEVSGSKPGTAPRPATAPPLLRAPAGGEAPMDVRLSDVTVIADDGRCVLDRVNLSIPAGAFVAITGAAGSGRTTLARVIAGMTTPTHGEVLIGGHPIADLASDGIRPTAYGQARPALLGGTIAGLIGLAVDSGPETVREAARLAHLVDVIDALPHGFDTPIAEVELSGGELQRLAIAQALSRSASVLVLDDVTASLDPATEREVLGALLAARANRTLVVVTNRSAVLDRADAVFTLAAGAVAELTGSAAAS